jgi:pyruvate/2-oxoglutarate dehydrogenase complex dihydrolipoamide acyltransferase (E2) component
MPTAIYTPRINNNDDTVRLAAMLVDIGSRVRTGDPVIDVETDKATFTVEATEDGYLIGVAGEKGDTLEVGSILAWIGAEANTPVPGNEKVTAEKTAQPSDRGASGRPSLKALLLQKRNRLTTGDAENHVARRGMQSLWPPPAVSGHAARFNPEQRAMARTVSWHRDEAAAGYIELAYDPEPWVRYAAEFQKAHSLLLSPLLALMACRLARLAAESPKINSTAEADGLYLYDQVNLAFTVQAGEKLYLVVLRDAAARSQQDFVRELGDLQRAALKHSLKAEQIGDATIGFTSMARWNVSRHLPILVPQTSLMVAHSATINGVAHLGASYDHRVLTGFDTAQVLRKLSVPA